jgi:hypothetical protein
MKVKELKKLIDKLNPEAEVFATRDALAQWLLEVEDAIAANVTELA